MWSRNKIIFLSAVALIVLSFLACSGNSAYSASLPRILFPASDVVIDPDTTIVLVATGEGTISWYDGDIAIGTGGTLSISLMSGEHRIYCVDSCGASTVRIVHVDSSVYVSGESRRYYIGMSSSSLVLPAGAYSPVVAALSVSGFGLSVDGIQSGVSVARSSVDRDFSLEPPPRDFRLPWSGKGAILPPPASRDLKPRTYERVFYMVDPLDYAGQANYVAARSIASGDGFTVWVDAAYQGNGDETLELASILDRIVIPRIWAVWGESLDVDGDGGVNILLSPKINETKKIIGFFNPSDCLSWNDDISSSDYNPSSNETDIVYLAVPDANTAAYSLASLAATVGHELRHLIHFQVKTLRRLRDGERDVPQEALFLDEGLSHLADSLCGYGESGGNLCFAQRYFASPWLYSLGSVDADGNEDSTGKRGGVAALLWQLFQESGGASWSAEDPAAITDLGGIAFLRGILNSRKFGWEAVAEAFGQDESGILLHWAETIAAKQAGKLPLSAAPRDPFTGELLAVAPFIGTFMYNGVEHSINGPATIEAFPLSPMYTVAWLTRFSIIRSERIQPRKVGDGFGVISFGMF